MTNDETVDVGLGAWSPPNQYSDPQLEQQGSKAIDEIKGPVDTVNRDQFGEEAEVLTLDGQAYAKDISILQKYRGKTLTLRHSVHSGKVYIESVRADTTDRWDELTDLRMHDGEMQDVTEEKQVYTYSVDLIKLQSIDEE